MCDTGDFEFDLNTESLKLNDEQLKKLIETIKFISHNQTLTKQLIKNLMKENYDNEEYWKHILEIIKLDNDFIYNNLKNINLKYLLKYQKLDNNFIINNYEILETVSSNDLWNVLFTYQTFDSNTLNTILLKYSPFDNEIWKTISKFQHLNSDIFELYNDLLDWNYITMHQHINFDIFCKYIKNINISLLHYNIILNCYINDKTVSMFDKKIFDNIGYYDNVSIDYIFNNLSDISEVGIISIIENRELSIDNINKLLELDITDKTKLINKICENQDIDDNFIELYKDYIDWDILSENLNWTTELIEKYFDNINLDLIVQNIYLSNSLCDKIKTLCIIKNKPINNLNFNDIIDL